MHMFSIIIPFIKTRVLFNLSFSVCVCVFLFSPFLRSAQACYINDSSAPRIGS